MKTSARLERIPFCLCVIFSLQLLLCRQAGGTCVASEHLHQHQHTGCVRLCMCGRKKKRNDVHTCPHLCNININWEHWIICLCTTHAAGKTQRWLFCTKSAKYTDHILCFRLEVTTLCTPVTHVNTLLLIIQNVMPSLPSSKAFCGTMMAFPFACPSAQQSGGNWFGQFTVEPQHFWKMLSLSQG